jgi:hypothetical protein
MSIEALSMVLNHSKALGSPKVVLLGIANHLGPDATEGAWPSQKRLAEYANLSERGVQKCVDKLVKSGELRVEVAGGHSRNQYRPNRYWITIECPDNCDKSMSHRRGELLDHGRTPVQSGANAGTVRGEPGFVLTVIEPLEETLENRNSNNRFEYESKFDEWWSYYPSKRGKGAAAKAYAKALKKVPHDYLLEKVMAFRDDPHRPVDFTPNPATWLNEERWNDDPYQPGKESAVQKAMRMTMLFQQQQEQKQIEGENDGSR